MYKDADYANSRLEGTVVMYKRVPVIVMHVSRRMLVRVRKLDRSQREHLVPLAELNLTNFPMGFINKGSGVSFLCRRTLRRDWRQGLRPSNVASSNGDTTFEDIAKALRQRYPSFAVAYSDVTKGLARERAWCPEFAVSCDNKLRWRFEVVGSFTNAAEVVLADEFKFLIHTLKDACNDSCKVL